MGNGPSQTVTVMTQGHYAAGRGRPGCWKRKKLRALAVGLAVHNTGGLQQGPCGVDVIKPKSHQAKKLVQGHPVNEWQTQDSNPRLTLKLGSFHSN